MEIEVLLSTMKQKNFNILKEMKITSNTVVINQTNFNSIKIFENNTDNKTIKWIDSTTKGLSKSRNIAIKNSSSDILLLADDDLIYRKDYKERIIETFEKNTEYDIIIFQVRGINREYKRYKERSKKLNKFSILKVSSVEIAFRRESIIKNKIMFNEIFGSGSVYYNGEEIIFLDKCLKKGLKIKYVPIEISDIHLGDSSWFEGYTSRYFETKGALFYELMPNVTIIYIILFALKKYNIYKNEVGLFFAIKYMIKGKKEYKKMRLKKN